MIHDVLLVDVNGDHLQPLRPGYNHYTGIPVKPKHNLQQKKGQQNRQHLWINTYRNNLWGQSSIYIHLPATYVPLVNIQKTCSLVVQGFDPSPYFTSIWFKGKCSRKTLYLLVKTHGFPVKISPQNHQDILTQQAGPADFAGR